MRPIREQKKASLADAGGTLRPGEGRNKTTARAVNTEGPSDCSKPTRESKTMAKEIEAGNQFEDDEQGQARHKMEKKIGRARENEIDNRSLRTDETQDRNLEREMVNTYIDRTQKSKSKNKT
jgi:hypothetical protein